jgi:hypothetical protein
MTNLSPAAQAVMRAAAAAYWDPEEDYEVASPAAIAAAALRAAADQVVPDKCPPIEDFNEFDQGYAVAHLTHRQNLLAIAAELRAK